MEHFVWAFVGAATTALALLLIVGGFLLREVNKRQTTWFDGAGQMLRMHRFVWLILGILTGCLGTSGAAIVYVQSIVK